MLTGIEKKRNSTIYIAPQENDSKAIIKYRSSSKKLAFLFLSQVFNNKNKTMIAKPITST
ncbi:hypothetical protein hrd7_25900 [Leptolinea sp. HRD-7]|nr:hypothetical protein hrd7_25900 [Leptolinea sp. HRD-7]